MAEVEQLTVELVAQVELVAAETALNHNQVQEGHQAQIPIQVQLI